MHPNVFIKQRRNRKHTIPDRHTDARVCVIRLCADPSTLFCTYTVVNIYSVCAALQLHCSLCESICHYAAVTLAVMLTFHPHVLKLVHVNSKNLGQENEPVAQSQLFFVAVHIRLQRRGLHRVWGWVQEQNSALSPLICAVIPTVFHFFFQGWMCG